MTDFEPLEKLCLDLNICCSKNRPLSDITSFKIGGRAPLIIEPSCTRDISQLVSFMASGDIPFLVLGKGSNTLFPDEGIERAVLLMGERFSAISADGDKITCESGASLTQLCRCALENSLSGLEFAYGIPGSVGGAVYMNAGAYGGEIKDVLLSACHVDPGGTLGWFNGGDLNMSYRRSAYSGSGLVITSAEFGLKRGDQAEIRAKMDDFLNRRRSKQPLELPSAGSTFKRPEGSYASALIDGCGLKGRAVGGAAVSEKHAGFVVNRGGASYSDVLGLIELVIKEVKKKTGHSLEPEVKIYNRAGEEVKKFGYRNSDRNVRGREISGCERP